jgi:hypothetical protein
MKTIEKITTYQLTDKEIQWLYYSEIVNGCWWKWGVNFDTILKQNIQLIPGFNEHKSEQLMQDIRMICFEHDIDFRFKKWFYKANYRFAKKMFKLLTWATPKQRFWIAALCFYFLNKYGRKFYYIKKKSWTTK